MSVSPSSQTSQTRGILLMMLAVTLFTLMAALIKAAPGVPPGEVVLFRSLPTVIILLAWFGALRRVGPALGTTDPWGHARRGIIGTISMGLNFAGLHYLPLPEVTALRFVTPILVVVFAIFLLGEVVRKVRLTAVGVGLLGVLIIVWPRLSVEGSSAEMIGALMMIGSAAAAALAQIYIKRMTGTETSTSIVFYFAITSSSLSLLTIPFGWVMPTPGEWALLIGAGIVGLAGQLCVTASYRNAEAGVLAPFTYVSMLWSIIIGWVWFREIPTVPMLAGSALIIVAGVAIFLRERQLGLKAATEGKVRAKGWQ